MGDDNVRALQHMHNEGNYKMNFLLAKSLLILINTLCMMQAYLFGSKESVEEWIDEEI